LDKERGPCKDAILYNSGAETINVICRVRPQYHKLRLSGGHLSGLKDRKLIEITETVEKRRG